MTDNFKQALKEVFTPNKTKAGDEPDNLAVVADNKQDLSVSKIDGAKEPDKVKKAVNNQPELKKSSMGQPSTKEPTGLHKNVITKDTKIMGTISTQSDLEISGIVEGDIESKGNLVATGHIRGKIICNSAEIDSAVIEGDLEITDSLVVKAGSQINGMLSAKSIHVSGQVTGDVTATSSVKVHSDACIIGNITTPTITVESGAILRGKIEVQKDIRVRKESVAKALAL